jgi:glycosyltransferase involved in cell wall biosynthesis
VTAGLASVTKYTSRYYSVPPRISIITPSYKQLEWLKLCASSIADQDGVRVEHIVQDAGTGAELDEWAPQQRGLKLYVEKDAGMYDAINRGLRKATGEICAYLNCDEQYLPGTLRDVANRFARNPKVDILFGDVVLVDRDGKALSYRRVIAPDKSHLLSSHLNTSSCATFFRRRLVERGLCFDTRWKAIGDLAWIYRLLDAGVCVETVPEPLAVFTFTGQNLGATSLTGQELEAWRKELPALSHFQRVTAIALHRLRKAIAGAYRPRQVKIDIYTLASPNVRQRIVTDNVGARWPTT